MSGSNFVVRGRINGCNQAVDINVSKGKVNAVRRTGRFSPEFGADEFIIAPLLFDVQVNGGFGVDLQSTAITVEDVHALDAALFVQGVAQWIPTLVTDDIAALEHKCEVLANALDDPALSAHIPGIHLEGPHISPLDGPRGAHPAAFVSPPSMSVFNRLYRAAKGKIACITLAPELPGAMRLIRAATERGIVVSLGHHAADACHIESAVAAGAKMCTHLGNGIAPQLHRHHNGLWPQLANDRLYASFIADLEHVPPEALKVFARAKGAQRTILASDSVFLAGMKPGKYDMFGSPVEMKKSGRICLAGTELLAGSSLMLLQGVWNMHRHTDMTLEQALASASTVPGRLFRRALPAWPPVKGESAAFMLCKLHLDRKGLSQLHANAVFYGGHVYAV